jgi:hypothetical protein
MGEGIQRSLLVFKSPQRHKEKNRNLQTKKICALCASVVKKILSPQRHREHKGNIYESLG